MNCAYCGKEFEQTTYNRRFCSKLCRQRAYRNMPLDGYVKTCKHCGKEFTANNGQRQYCSPKCRKHAELARTRDDRNAKRREKYQVTQPRGNKRRQPIPEIPTVPIVPSKFSPPPPPHPPKIIIPAAVAGNRKPTVDELLDWIFSEERRHAL